MVHGYKGHIWNQLVKEGGIGFFGFPVLVIFEIGFSVFAVKIFGFSVLVPTTVYDFFPRFDIRFSVYILIKKRVLAFVIRLSNS